MDREQLLTTIKHQLGDINIAVEVGVWRGDYSRFIISTLAPTTFIGVDPYEIYEGYTDKPDELEFANQQNLDILFRNVSDFFQGFNKNSATPIYRYVATIDANGNRSSEQERVITYVDPYGKLRFPYQEVTVSDDLTQTNCTLVREFGTNYAPQFANNTIDFVYLDSDHKYEAIKSEIEAWYPKVRKGGVLAGHDYVTGSHIEEFGVIPAVTEFIERENLTLHTTDEAYSSWWVTKT